MDKRPSAGTIVELSMLMHTLHQTQLAMQVFSKFFGTNNPFLAESIASAAVVPVQRASIRAELVICNLFVTLEEIYRGCIRTVNVAVRRLNRDGQTTSDQVHHRCDF